MKTFIVTDEGSHFEPMVYQAESKEALLDYLQPRGGRSFDETRYIVQEVLIRRLQDGRTTTHNS